MSGRILILRPQPGADESAARARALGLKPMVAPLFTVQPLDWTPPEADGFDAILLTSANAARHGGPGLAHYFELPCYAVGERTAEEARAAGFADVRSGPADGAALVAQAVFDGVGAALHLCGRDHVALADPAIAITAVSVYAADPVARLPDGIEQALVLLHSPRSAAVFAALAGERRAGIRIAAISARAAAAAGPGWKAVAVADAPRDHALLELAAKLCQTDGEDEKASRSMSGVYDPVDNLGAAPPRRSWLAWLLLPGLAFLLGLGAMGFTLGRWDGAARLIGVAPEPVAPPPAEPAALPILVQPEPAPVTAGTATPERIVIDPEITRRVAALEARLGQVGTEARAAVGNADRAEGLLVAFAARRALDRGVALGFLEALLSQRFGETQPQAVGTIITAAREPVTLQELQDGLQQVSPQLVGPPPEQNWWGAIRSELGNLVTVRREGTPSTEPTERLRRATRRLEAGQVDVALVEILRLPAREVARDWIVKARRYVIARRALDAIETAALLEPRTRPQPAPVTAAPSPDAPAPAPATVAPAR